MGWRVVLESFVARVRLQPNFPLVLIGILFFILPYGGIIVLQRRLFQRAALQARFRSRTSLPPDTALTLCSESTMSWSSLPGLPHFTPDIIMRL
jgi:hypothetical protein